jgi:hypothetical protein
VNELGELRTQLLARFDRGINFLLDHHLPSREPGAATMICDQAARRLLRDGWETEAAWGPAVRQSWLDCIDDYRPGTEPAQPPVETRHPSNRELISLLDKLEDLDRQVVLRYYRSGQEKSVICCALELSDYHFNQIMARVKDRYVQDPEAPPSDSEIPISPFGDRLDRYLLNQCTEKQAQETEIAILEQPAIIQEARVTKDLIGALRQAHLPRRWRPAGGRGNRQAKDRLLRRRPRGIWRFLTRPCLGAAASVACVIGIVGSWIMWDMQRIDAVMTQPTSAIIVPLRIAQTRGYRPSALLELPSQISVVSVSLDIGTPQNTHYRISLIDAGGQMLWQQHDIMPGDDELLHFLVGSEMLTNGVHRFLVEPIDGPGHRIPLAFQVEISDSA